MMIERIGAGDEVPRALKQILPAQQGPDALVALLTLFEILEVAGRADLKSDLEDFE